MKREWTGINTVKPKMIHSFRVFVRNFMWNCVHANQSGFHMNSFARLILEKRQKATLIWMIGATNSLKFIWGTCTLTPSPCPCPCSSPPNLASVSTFLGVHIRTVGMLSKMPYCLHLLLECVIVPAVNSYARTLCCTISRYRTFYYFINLLFNVLLRLW